MTVKYCSSYSCGRLLPEDFDGDICPYCGVKEYEWNKGDYFKSLPEEAKDIKQECHKCGSTEELKYSKPYYYGTNDQYMMGNEFECQTCYNEWRKEIERQEAMNYLLVDPHDDETHFFYNKSGVEDFFEDMFDEYYHEGDDPLDGFVVLKVEKVERMPSYKDFQNRNMIQYDYEWYRVEEVSEPEYEYNGEHSVYW